MKRPADYPYADTRAARTLFEALEGITVAEGLSLRQLGRNLGYKQSVVLSHMASGRVPIPIERASGLAAALKMNTRDFALAVLEQRYTGTDWRDLFGTGAVQDASGEFDGCLAGVRLASLSDDHKAIARELVRDTHPRERWLAIPEVIAVKVMRQLRPEVSTVGLSPDEIRRVTEVLGPQKMRVDQHAEMR